MILDVTDRLPIYLPLLETNQPIMEILQEMLLVPPQDGIKEIDGDRAFVIVQECEGKVNAARLEAHRKYIDIQLVLRGEDTMGWKPLGECAAPIEPYCPEKDILFFNDKPQTFFTVPQSHFAIFFPQDAHAPLAGKGTVKKAVVKISSNLTPRESP